MTAAAQAYADYFADLQPQSLSQLDRFYSHDADFIDPFNHVKGIPAIQKIFAHMFEHYPQSEFEVLELLGSGQHYALHWLYSPRPGGDIHIEGMSLVRFNTSGLCYLHQDFWDSISELFTHVPLLKHPAHWLIQRLQVDRNDQHSLRPALVRSFTKSGHSTIIRENHEHVDT